MNLRQQLNQLRIDKIPPGWYSLEQLARREGFSDPRSARPMIRDCLKARLLEQRLFTVPWGAGLRKRPYYRYRKSA